VKIVHLRKYRWSRSGDGGAPHDVELGRLQGNDNDKRDNDYCDSDEDYFEHGNFSPRE
jgi:hypothetical protein